MTFCCRTDLLTQLAATITKRRIGRPVRVAVDGRTAAGKTTIADELATLIQRAGREIIRTSIDGFHRSRAERYVRGRYSAEGYYYDARDFSAVRRLLLDPLGPNGDHRYCTASFDLENDRPVQQDAQTASVDAILIVDGTFLQRPELVQAWDLTIFIEVSPQLCEHRGIERDAGALGGVEAARHLYATRYRPAFELYEKLCAPASAAHVVLNNDDFDKPRMTLRKHDLQSICASLSTPKL